MEKSNKTNISCSWPIPTVLFLVFFFAKIFDKIDWSWWWVFSPLWIPAIILVASIAVLIMLKIWAEKW